MPYSIDLRKRVVGAVDSGIRIAAAFKLFKIGRKVIYSWLKFYEF